MEKLTKLEDPRQKLSNYIDWDMFKAPLDKASSDEAKDRSKGKFHAFLRAKKERQSARQQNVLAF